MHGDAVIVVAWRRLRRASKRPRRRIQRCDAYKRAIATAVSCGGALSSCNFLNNSALEVTAQSKESRACGCDLADS